MLVQHLLEGNADSRPGSVALVSGGRRLTYSDVERDANRLAHLLIQAGVHRGDRIAILLENSAEAVISVFAALKVGAIFVVLNPA